MNKIKDILKDKKKKYILFGIIGLIVISVIVAIIFVNKPTYSNAKINNLQFKDEVHSLLKQYDDENLEEMLLDYIKDSMQQYNKINKDTFKQSEKGQVFTDYFGDMNIRDYDKETQDIIFDIHEIAYINARAIIKELHYNNLGTDDEKLILDKTYYKYLDNLKKQIDKVVKKYCK